MAFDTLSYARKLKAAGMPDAQAEAVADATREIVAQDIATKTDLAAVEQRLIYAMEMLALKVTVRTGGLIAAGVAVLAAIIKL